MSKLDEIFNIYEDNKDEETITEEWEELKFMKNTLGIDVDNESVCDGIVELARKRERRGFFNGFQYATELWMDLEERKVKNGN